MIKFKEKTIRVYHVTKDINIESIKRDGLLVEKYKKPSGNFSEDNIARPFPKVLYFSSDPRKLVKLPEQGKFSVLVLDIPVRLLIKRNQIFKFYNGPEDYAIRNLKEFIKLSPVIKEKAMKYLRKYGLKKESDIEDIYPKTPFCKYMEEAYVKLKDFTYISEYDIPKECISDILSENDFKKILSPKDLKEYHIIKETIREFQN